MNEICYGCHNCKYWLNFGDSEYGTCCYISCESSFDYVKEKSMPAYVESVSNKSFKTHMDFFCNQHDIAHDFNGD